MYGDYRKCLMSKESTVVKSILVLPSSEEFLCCEGKCIFYCNVSLNIEVYTV